MPARSGARGPVLEGIVEDGEARHVAPDAVASRMRGEILDGAHWFDALLDAVGRWRLPVEEVDGVEYRYLIGSEAFDWLLLAERLLDEVSDLVPREEREALLFEGRWPRQVEDEELVRRIGPAKHSAHLNYLYGVLVEQALQLHVEEEIHKERRSSVWGADARVDEAMHERVYGCRREELFSRYYEETGELIINEVSLGELKEFTYWLFRLRLRQQDRARIASDTRKGLAQLSRMERAVRRRRPGARLDEDDFLERFGDRRTG